MSVSITSFTPNTKAQSAQVNTNFNNCAQGITDASHRGFSWGILGSLATGAAQGIQYIVPQGVTIKTIYAKTTSGTATIEINVNGSAIIDPASHMAVTSTVSSVTVFTIATLTAGQVLTLDIDAASGTDVFVMLETIATVNN